MKESVGYTVTLNIAITFIVIVFTFLSSAFIFFKSNKMSNAIMNSIEKYEGYNDYAIAEIKDKIADYGYATSNANCGSTISYKGKACTYVSTTESNLGYCVYYCDSSDGYYFYRVRTYMQINIPIVNRLINFPIFSNTNRLYDFQSE